MAKAWHGGVKRRATEHEIFASFTLHTPSPRPPTAGGTVKRQAELFFPAEFADDFPVSLQTSDKYGLIYVITKLGLLFVYDLETATAVYRNRISPDPIFIAAASESTGGFYAINRRGQVSIPVGLV